VQGEQWEESAVEASTTDAPENMMAVGTRYSIIGGSMYALAALITSLAVLRLEAGLLSARTVNWFKFLALLVLLFGGVNVTFAYGTGGSVPVFNAIVYSTNLGLNMLFQIAFKLTTYTKAMRTGTMLFIFATAQLGGLAPEPPPLSEIDTSRPLAPECLPFEIIFVLLWIGTGFGIRVFRNAPKKNPVKTLMWAVHVSCWGSLTDHWAKIQGTWEIDYPNRYLVSWGFYSVVGIGLMALSVQAMAETQVAIYVPTNLCSQLVLNIIGDFIIWQVAERIPDIPPLVAVYVICILGVYITSVELDVGASTAAIMERCGKGMSRGVGKTRFGRSVLKLFGLWMEPSEDPEEVQLAVVDMIKEGHEVKAFTQEDLVDLMMVLWKQSSPEYLPLKEFTDFLDKSDYFAKYNEKDPAFKNKLEAVAIQGARRSTALTNLFL